MPIHRRLTARNALIALLAWLFIALVLHLKAELWDSSPAAGSADAPAGNDDVLNGEAQHGSSTKKIGVEKGGEKRRTAVVVASQASENATWLDEYFPQWEKNIYRVDNKSAPLTVPKNKGRESMVYLT